jgi:D-serine deaminase-like pyridoxal phosphate-dependent protein
LARLSTRHALIVRDRRFSIAAGKARLLISAIDDKEERVLIDDLETPAVTCDLDVLERNIRQMAERCREVDIPFRAHTKSHMIPEIAHWQVAAGAIGICSQKIGQAEVMVAAGLRDILIPFNIVGASKVERLIRLTRRAAITVAVDSAETARGIAEQASAAGARVPVVIELDTGGRRCGVQSPEDAQRLARVISDLPGLEFRGIMTYPSRPEAKPFLEQTRDLLERDGLPLSVVSGGGTGAEAVSKELSCTETRSGSYVWEGLSRVKSGADLNPERCPMRVVCTVVSVPTPDRIILDGGIKTFGVFPATATPPCYMVEHPRAKLRPFSIEHTTVDVSECDHRFRVGDRVSVIPLHGEICLNLHDQLHGTRDGRVEVIWTTWSRGRIR